MLSNCIVWILRAIYKRVNRVVMSKVTIIATFRVDDNEYLRNKLIDSFICESYRGHKVLDEDNELYISDPEYKKLCNTEKVAKQAKKDYFYKTKNKTK